MYFLFMYVLTNTWTGNLVKAVIPRPDPSGAAVPGVGKVSSDLIILSTDALSRNKIILIRGLCCPRCRCFWNMQISTARPRRRSGCMAGSLAGTRWWPCSILKTSLLMEITMIR
uniref:Uncharacterized protein n=1 Tax=Aegilops tauschii subsp. strangulata TaxID=200361 RepID=A0A453HXG9_AEGTS